MLAVSDPVAPPSPIFRMPPLMVTTPALSLLPLKVNWPALTVVTPVRVLLPAKVAVPEPLCVKLP